MTGSKFLWSVGGLMLLMMVQSLTILTISMVDCKCVSENKYVSRKSKKEEGGSMLQSACA